MDAIAEGIDIENPGGWTHGGDIVEDVRSRLKSHADATHNGELHVLELWKV